MGKTTAIAAALMMLVAKGAEAQADDAIQRAEVNSELMAKCTADVRRLLPDPATFLLNRRASQQPDTINGTWTWMFSFDAATKKGGQGHYSGFCTQNSDGTVSAIIA